MYPARSKSSAFSIIMGSWPLWRMRAASVSPETPAPIISVRILSSAFPFIIRSQLRLAPPSSGLVAATHRYPLGLTCKPLGDGSTGFQFSTTPSLADRILQFKRGQRETVFLQGNGHIVFPQWEESLERFSSAQKPGPDGRFWGRCARASPRGWTSDEVTDTYRGVG